MNKSEFLAELEKKLKFIPKEDREDALEYYRELFADMELTEEEDVTDRVGSMDAVVRDILDVSTQKVIDKKNEGKVLGKSAKVIGFCILGLLFLAVPFPVALVLALAGVVILIIDILVLAVLVITGAAVALGGILLAIIAFRAGWPQLFMVFGTGLLMCAIGIFLFAGSLKLWQLLLRGVAKMCNRIAKKK